MNLNNDVKVCSTSVTDANPTACADAKNTPSSGNPRYYVLALAPARAPATGTERSALPAYASTLQADAPNTPPTAPTSITATVLTGGGVKLTWTAAITPT